MPVKFKKCPCNHQVSQSNEVDCQFKTYLSHTDGVDEIVFFPHGSSIYLNPLRDISLLLAKPTSEPADNYWYIPLTEGATSVYLRCLLSFKNHRCYLRRLKCISGPIATNAAYPLSLDAD